MRFFANGSKNVLRWMAATAFVVMLFLGGATDAKAQYLTRWMNIGDLHHQFTQLGMHEWVADGLMWPGIENRSSMEYVKRFRIGATNLENMSGEPGPTTFSIYFRERNEQEFWPIKFEMVSKRPATKVTVDGLPTFDKVAIVDRVDPDLPSDRMFYSRVGTFAGLDIEQKIYFWGNEPFDDFFIRVRNIINTGITEKDSEEPREKTLENLRFGLTQKMVGPRQGGALSSSIQWGVGNDYGRTVAGREGNEGFVPDFTSLYAWSGYQASFSDWNIIGHPLMYDDSWKVNDGDSIGRLSGAQMAGYTSLYADSRAHAPGENVPPAGDELPCCTWWQTAPDFPGATWSRYLTVPHLPKFQDELSNPTEAFPDTMTWRERQAFSETEHYRPGGGPNRFGWAYGPYDIEPGQVVTTVNARGVMGPSRKARHEIGRAYKRIWERGQDTYTPIEFDADGDGKITPVHTVETADEPWEIVGEPYERMSKNEWVFTSRDSLYQMFKRARAAWEAGLQIPERPVQPARFAVNSRPDRIELKWTLYQDAPVPDSFAVYRSLPGVRDPGWRTLHEHIGTVPASEGTREYVFNDNQASEENPNGVQRGIGYFYYVEAIDAVENSPVPEIMPNGTIARSGRYWTQTYTPARLVRSPGEEIADVEVVPNPYSLNQASEVKYGTEDRLGFLNVPGNATIRIYTEAGELIKQIEHTDRSGDEYWNLSTESNQRVTSGIYVALIRDNDTGEEVIRRFVIIR